MDHLTEPASPIVGSPGSIDPTSPDHAEIELGPIVDDAVPGRGYAMQPVVGLGGSAGSIQALRAFFGAAEPNSGLAYVVVLHLAADRESRLAELLQAATSMPVIQVTQRERLQPNHVYVIPPGKALAAMDGELHLAELPDERGQRVAVDLFFRTLADSHGPHAIAIVLSGADGDGAIGVKRIKERGGLTIVQDPGEAEHPAMPRSAIATGTIDWILPVADMPRRLGRYNAIERSLRLPSENGPQPAKRAHVGNDALETALRDVLAHLHSRTGHDFTYYKRATILRRIARRMKLNETEDLTGYLALLRTHIGESAALLQDLLISVTNFFRDREAFDALDGQIPALFANRGDDAPLRIWVAACATGEEAYSIAMLLAERSRDLGARLPFQIFATDLDEAAIRTAREGVYPSTIAADVSDERLSRFFVKDVRGFRVRSELRETILFAHHDLLRDSPFSRVDLVSCRNLLIYLDRDAQERALDIFHFSLRPGGRLFLGSSETAEHSGDFRTVDKRFRVFSPIPSTRPMPIPAGQTTVARTLELQKEGAERTVPSRAYATSAPGTAARRREEEPARRRDDGSWRGLHIRLLERLAPPSLLATPSYDIVHLSEHAGKFLQVSAGDPSLNLLNIIHPSLGVEMRTVLLRAEASEETVRSAPLAVEIAGERTVVVLRVSRTSDAEGRNLLVVFEPHDAGGSDVPAIRDPAPRDDRLEREIEDLKWHLRDLTERRDLAIEELKSGNEELHAMNEELRSATEELETSREELQSINEELTTVNHEMKSKVDALAQSNADLQNLIVATSVAALFLTRDLTISRFTPSVVQLFKLIPGDIGRPLDDLARTVDYPQVSDDARSVLETLVPREREVQAGMRWLLVRVLPYRTHDDRIAGVVITFTDITARRNAEGAVRRSEQRMRAILDNAIEYAIVSMDLHRTVTAWNVGAERILGWSRDEMMGHPADVLFTTEDREVGAPQREAEDAIAHGTAADERLHLRKDGSTFWGSGVMMPLRDEVGRPVGLLKIFRDQSDAREAQEKLAVSRQGLEDAFTATVVARAELEESNRAKDRFLAILSHELRTPLTPVVMATRALERDASLPSSARAMVDVIRRNVTAELHLIDDLLDVTRISAGKLMIVREPIDLHAIVHEALEICEADVQARGHVLSLDLAAVPARIVGDPNRLRQAVWNLVRNAAKFTPQGGRIRVTSRRRGDRIEVAVADNGIGIEEGRIVSIFDAFEQGPERIVRDFGGLGLGLAIVKAIVEAHGGTLRAESPGMELGATFVLSLPLPTD